MFPTNIVDLIYNKLDVDLMIELDYFHKLDNVVVVVDVLL